MFLIADSKTKRKLQTNEAVCSFAQPKNFSSKSQNSYLICTFSTLFQVDTETADQQQNQQQSQPSGSKKAQTTRMLRTFDRLTPRYCDDNKNKRKATSNFSDEDTASAAKKAAIQSGGAKKEYSKLKTLVPALTEREDLSKVEIIEETIRYIDALHHQLANRGINPPNQSSETEEQQTQQPETNPESKLLLMQYDYFS